MKLIFCLSKDKGMMFFGKRQSKDAVLNEWILNHIGSSQLWMSSYSGKMFGANDKIIIDDDYVNKAAADDYCFIEDKPYSLEKASEIIICNWNRAYPGDVKFTADLKADGFKKVESVDIVGSSHEKITIEMYKKG